MYLTAESLNCLILETYCEINTAFCAHFNSKTTRFRKIKKVEKILKKVLTFAKSGVILSKH